MVAVSTTQLSAKAATTKLMNATGITENDTVSTKRLGDKNKFGSASGSTATTANGMQTKFTFPTLNSQPEPHSKYNVIDNVTLQVADNSPEVSAISSKDGHVYQQSQTHQEKTKSNEFAIGFSVLAAILALICIIFVTWRLLKIR